MREELADLVYPVVHHALRLKQRLAAGEEVSLEREQSALKGMLLSDVESRRWPEFGGERRADGESFIGLRYALACWLDEIFILDSSWEVAWAERKLEAALYGTNDRAWKFWEQARLAEDRASNDALETFFLCVMLGFRGEWSGRSKQLGDWVEGVKGRLSRREPSWAPPAESPPLPPLTALRGPEQLQRLTLAVALTLVLLAPLAAFAVVRWLGG